MHILFPLGVRLSTWIFVVAFLALAVRRRDSAPLFAALLWLSSFEAVFQSMHFLLGIPFVIGPAGSIFYIALGALTVAWGAWHRVLNVDLRLLGLGVAVGAVWVGTGFHVNAHDQYGFSLSAEVLNESVKTLWALAFLVPLLNAKSAPRPKAGGATIAQRSV